MEKTTAALDLDRVRQDPSLLKTALESISGVDVRVDVEGRGTFFQPVSVSARQNVMAPWLIKIVDQAFDFGDLGLDIDPDAAAGIRFGANEVTGVGQGIDPTKLKNLMVMGGGGNDRLLGPVSGDPAVTISGRGGSDLLESIELVDQDRTSQGNVLLINRGLPVRVESGDPHDVALLLPAPLDDREVINVQIPRAGRGAGRVRLKTCGTGSSRADSNLNLGDNGNQIQLGEGNGNVVAARGRDEVWCWGPGSA